MAFLLAPGVRRLLAALLALFCTLAEGQATTPEVQTLVPALGWDLQKQGGFPTSLATDQKGQLWVGTEGNGLWRYDPAAGTWRQFTEKDGLGDDCVYALGVDKLNRIWAGHLNHGVSVYDGEKWRNYSFLDGPLGDRVFAIAVCPTDGDVWMATDLGLARYAEERADWDYYTRASGLPTDQIQCLAFDPEGGLYAGTQCEGIACATPGDDYRKWHSYVAKAPAPADHAGPGMVSDLINRIVFAALPRHGSRMVAAATPLGMEGLAPDPHEAASVADFHVRGGDWKLHTKGAGESGGADEGAPDIALAEDWMTDFALSGAAGWVAYRKAGVERRDLATGQVELRATPPATATIRAMLVADQQQQPPLFAVYSGSCGGLMTLPNAPAFEPITSGTLSTTAPKLPAPAQLPQVADAKPLAERLGKLTQQLTPGEAIYLADDWRTQGDWIGRYGSGYAKLCGIGDQGDQDYNLQPGYEVTLGLGPHHARPDEPTTWYHGDETSDDQRSLYDPTLGARRDAEENDGSFDRKTYNDDYDGPDLWVTAKIPEGVHCLSLYFCNYDAHKGSSNMHRDYVLEVLPWSADPGDVQKAKPLARARVTDFWGGVYKQFVLCGPATFVVRIGRNRSFVTKVQGVFLDRISGNLDEPPGQLPGFADEPYTPPDEPDNFNPGGVAAFALNLWTQLDDALALRGAVPLQMPFRLWCYRAAAAAQVPPALLERWRWQISEWTPGDRQKFDEAMRKAHDASR